jgi:predicted P-loop ATPase
MKNGNLSHAAENVFPSMEEQTRILRAAVERAASEPAPQTEPQTEPTPRRNRRNIWAEVEAALTKNYVFKYNLITGRLLWAVQHEENHKPHVFSEVNDRFISRVRRELALQSDFVAASGELVQSVILAIAKEFNPIAAYFNTLPKWDGRDYIGEAAALVSPIAEHSAIWQHYFRRWIVGTVACGLFNKPNHGILTLKGAQGVGKTTFLLKLFPSELKKYCSSSESVTDANKDAKIMVAEKFIAVLDELDSSTKSEISFLKSLVTVPTISVRRPYAAYAETLNRICSFAASVNTDDFLRDATGNRRFWVIEVESIKNGAINTDGLYAQALALYERGEKYWFDGEELATIAETNQQFEATTIEESVLLQYFEPIPLARAGKEDFYLSSDILSVLEGKAGKLLNNRNLGIALRKHGFTRVAKRLRGMRAYFYAAKQHLETAKITDCDAS